MVGIASSSGDEQAVEKIGAGRKVYKIAQPGGGLKEVGRLMGWSETQRGAEGASGGN